MQQPLEKIPSFLLNLAKKFWPDLEKRTGERLVVGVGEVISTLYSIPFTIVGLLWLIYLTDLNWIKSNFLYFLLFGVLVSVFNQLQFFLKRKLRLKIL